jgi:hypothetical protein
MIVEISARDHMRLSLGDDVEVGGVTLRLSLTLTESTANGAESLTDTRKRTAKRKVFAMHTKFNGRCRECRTALSKGDSVVLDTSAKGALCMKCGTPVLAAFERETGTTV